MSQNLIARNKYMPEENKEQKAYRDLEEVEINALFSFYDKHNGNVLEMTKDVDIPFKAKSQIYFYRDKYDFVTKLSKIKTLRAEKFKKEWEDKLKKGKEKAIERAIGLLEIRTIQKETKDGDIIDITIYPDNKDIKTAYEIMKIELGEPTTISRNTNIDETEEVKQALNILKNGINKECNTIISDREQTSRVDTYTAEHIQDNSDKATQKSNNDTSNSIRKESNGSSSGDSEVNSI
jgi:hypothetical protein